jgi:hypothetical protein
MKSAHAPKGVAGSTGLVRLLVGVLLVAAFAFSLRIVNYSHEPAPDELYHLLAAQSWVEDGSFAIADGQYTRARPFTRLVGLVHAATGGDLDSIRVASIVLGTLFVVAVLLGVRLLAGETESLIAAVMLALMPGAIFLSQFIRFYTLHALAFWLASLCLYVLVTRTLSKLAQLALVAATVALLMFAMRLQITTMIGVLALLVWLVASYLPAAWAWYVARPRETRLAVIAALALLALAGLYLVTGPLAYLVDSYRSSSLWSTETGVGYYALRYRDQYGLFWSLFPVALIVALFANWRPAFFCACIFVTAFLLHSFAGMRSERYLFYAMPFFVAIWGIALRDLFGNFFRWLKAGLAARFWPEGGVPGAVSAATVVLLVLWMVLLTPATELSVRMAVDKPGLVPRYWFNYVTSWAAGRDRIRELVAESDVFLTSQGHHAFYYIGDFDIEMSATGLSDFQTGPGEPDIDPRTGRRVIAAPDALQAIVACHDSGVVVVDRQSWRSFIGVNDDVADFIEANLQAVSVPDEWGMEIYRWTADDSLLNERRRAWRTAGPPCPAGG